jgi:hypothetical protein
VFSHVVSHKINASLPRFLLVLRERTTAELCVGDLLLRKQDFAGVDSAHFAGEASFLCELAICCEDNVVGSGCWHDCLLIFH